MNTAPTPPPAPPGATPVRTPNRTRLMIALVALVSAMPFVSAWIAYYIVKPGGAESNYGQLLEVRPLTPPALPTAELEALRGKWLLVNHLPADCAEPAAADDCETTLYATRQAHTMLGRERGRVLRLVVTTAPLPEALAAQHPNLIRWQIAPEALPADWRQALEQGILVIDPLGNEVMGWSRAPDIKRLNRDLTRLLRASAIG